jgi:hypothetical protein
MESESDEVPGPLAFVQSVVGDPETGRQELPTLLRLLDEGNVHVRISAAWALCLIASECDDMVAPLTRRLVDRLDEDALETEHALAYLHARFPETVEETLTELEGEQDDDEGDPQFDESRGFKRAGYYGQQGLGRGHSRGHIPGENEPGPRRVYAEEGKRVGGSPEDALEVDLSAEARERLTDTDAADESEDEEETADGNEDEADEDESTEGLTDDEHEVIERREKLAEFAAARESASIDEITAASQFDRLELVTTGTRGRYGDVYRLRATWGTREEGISLQLFHRPEEETEAFSDELAARLENWNGIADHEFVVGIYDWSRRPRPWIATELTSDSLYERLDMGLTEAVWNALKIAETVEYAHQRGVLHTGLDPYAVVYAEDTMSERRQPLLRNFGLLDGLRAYLDPTDLLDPRYAAPEYFDDTYGEVDQSTDVYQIGAVIYKLVTGRPPFQGSYDEVRTSVLGTAPLPPSEINPEIPTGVDQVVRKAMAKQKLTRFETVNHLVTDLKRTLGTG